MEEYKKFLNNANILLISKSIMKLVAFLMIPIYTRYLTKEEYGNIITLSAHFIIEYTVNLIIPLFTLGISEAVFRFTVDNKKETFKIGLRIVFLSYVIVSILSVFVYKYILSYKYMHLIVLYYMLVALYDYQYKY